MDAFARDKHRGLSQDDCNNAYHQVFDRLFQAIGRAEGWMELARE
jgi:hypothetical protein